MILGMTGLAAQSRRIEATVPAEEADRAALRDADIAQNAAFQQAMLDVAKGGLDRARSNAETVQKAAGAIGTLYTGVLGIAFSVTSRPLPLRGVLPALFLGLSVALSTAYLAYLSRHQDTEGGQAFESKATGLEGQLDRVTFLVGWVGAAVRTRAGLLRASVVALALGVVLLPLPFVVVPGVTDRARPAAAVPAWPPAPVAGGSEADMAARRMLYQAQVDEVAKQRAAAAQTVAPGDQSVLVGVGLLGLLIVVAGGVTGPLVSRRRKGGGGFWVGPLTTMRGPHTG